MGASANGNVGLCVDVAAPTGVLSLIGNKFTASDCRMINQAALILQPNCDGTHQDIGGQAATLATSFDVTECTLNK
jgi:hypothetical protein